MNNLLKIKNSIILTLLGMSFMVFGDTNNLIKYNEEAFTRKEILANRELCNYHSELLVQVGRPALPCARRVETDELGDKKLEKQEKAISNLTSLTQKPLETNLLEINNN